MDSRAHLILTTAQVVHRGLVVSFELIELSKVLFCVISILEKEAGWIITAYVCVAHVVELLAEVILDELSLLRREHMSMCIKLARCRFELVG